MLVLSDRQLFLNYQVETLLEQLDSKFDDMSTQILDRSKCTFDLLFQPCTYCKLSHSIPSEPNVHQSGCLGSINTRYHKRRCGQRATVTRCSSWNYWSDTLTFGIKIVLCISSLLREFALYYVGRKRIIIVSYES